MGKGILKVVDSALKGCNRLKLECDAVLINRLHYILTQQRPEWVSLPVCTPVSFESAMRMRKRCLTDKTFSLLCWLPLAELTSVDPAISFMVIAKVLCHCVLP